MKMTKLSAIVALTLGGLLLCSTSALAQDNKDSKDGGSGKGRKGGFGTVEQRMDRMSKELKLTDEQKPKVKVVLEEQDKKMRDVAPEDRRTKGREIRDETNKKMKEILTADQYKQYEEMNARFRGKKGGGTEGDTKKEGADKKN